VKLRIVPIGLDEANNFVVALHRHNGRLPGCKFCVGVEFAGKLVGVAIVGQPSAPALQKIRTLIEIRRVCTDGTRNACSKLYGAARRAARAMGHAPVITYTLPSEGGASLRAAGFELDKTDAGGPSRWWGSRDGREVSPIEDDLVGGKWRWVG